MLFHLIERPSALCDHFWTCPEDGFSKEGLLYMGFFFKTISHEPVVNIYFICSYNAYIFSPDYKLLAVSLLDNTVKVFFADTLKVSLTTQPVSLNSLISTSEHWIIFVVKNGEKKLVD